MKLLILIKNAVLVRGFDLSQSEALKLEHIDGLLLAAALDQIARCLAVLLKTLVASIRSWSK